MNSVYTLLQKHKFAVIFFLIFFLSIISWSFWFFFIRIIPKEVRINANPNWVRITTGYACGKKVPELQQSIFDGISGEARGHFKAQFLLDKAETTEVAVLSIKGGERNMDISLVGLPSPIDLKITKNTKIKDSKWYGFFIYTRRENKQEGDLKSNAPIIISQDQPPLRFTLPKKIQLHIKFFESEIKDYPLETLPKEFMFRPPLETEEWGSKLKPATQSAETAILLFHNSHKYREGKQVEDTQNDVMVNIKKLSGGLTSASVFLGKAEDHHGDFEIKLLELTHMLPVWISQNSEKPMSFAISPEHFEKGDSPRFIIKGGVKEVFLTGPFCSLSLGKEKYSLSSTDQLQISGDDLFLGLNFQAKSLPQLTMDGNAVSCKLNSDELLSTSWGSLNPTFRGGMAASLLGLLVGFIISRFFQKREK